MQLVSGLVAFIAFERIIEIKSIINSASNALFFFIQTTSLSQSTNGFDYLVWTRKTGSRGRN
ncbi:MAG: hypothetical protein AB8I56_09095 [Anaerolineales bacterium]